MENNHMQTYKRVAFFEETSLMHQCNDELALGACDSRIFSCHLKVDPYCFKIFLHNSFLHGRGILVLMNKALTKKNKKNTRNKSSHSLICYIASHVCNCLIVHWD